MHFPVALKVWQEVDFITGAVQTQRQHLLLCFFSNFIATDKKRSHAVSSQSCSAQVKTQLM